MEVRYPIGYMLKAALGFIFTCMAYLLYEFHPSEILTSQVIKFTPNSITFNYWKTPPYEILAKMYVYNVTNPEEFLRGEEKIKIREVGPYTYREIIYNTNITFNDNGTVSFIPKRKLEFSIQNSIGNASVDRYIVPNIALLALTSYLHSSSMFTNLAFSSLTSYLGSQLFLNLTVEEYLLGYDDTLIKLANTVIPDWIDFERLGILDRVMALDNSSDIVTINIKPESDYSVLTREKTVIPYAIERWSNSPGLSHWGYDIDGTNSKCNTVEGTLMGTLYPANLNVNQTLRLFRKSFCRPIPFDFHSSRLTKDGFDVNIYKVDPKYLLRAENNSENSCYCLQKNPEDCPLNGIGDLSPCYYGLPIAMSLPHFLATDSSVLEKIEGLDPRPEKHEMMFGIHPKLGVPLELHLRTQINLIIPDTKYNRKTKPFNNHVLPLFWIDLCVERIPSSIQLYLTLLYSVLPIAEKILIYVFVVSGCVLFCYSSTVALMVLLKDSKDKGAKYRYSPLSLSLIKQNLLGRDDPS